MVIDASVKVNDNGKREGCQGGGIQIADGTIGVSGKGGLEVQGNGGSGIVTRTAGLNILSNVRILNNQGPGMDIKGGVDIHGDGLCQVNGNQGLGIAVSGPSHEGPDKPGGVGVLAPLEVLDNCGWGMALTGKANIVIDASVRVNDNGKREGCQGGGIQIENGFIEMAADPIVSPKAGLEVQGNGGPGIVTQKAEHHTLSNVKILNNRGPGVDVKGDLSMFGNSLCQVKGNQGVGIAVSGPSPQGSDAPGEISIVAVEAPLEVLDNCGWGITLTGKANMVFNASAKVSENGKRAGCQGGGIQIADGSITMLSFKAGLEVTANGGNGILCNGDIAAYNVRVEENTGDGINASAFVVKIRQGKVCRNQGKGIVAREVDIEPPNVCENQSHGIQVGAPGAASKSTLLQLSSDGSGEATGSSRIIGGMIVGNKGDGVRFEGGPPLSIQRNNLLTNTGFGVNNLSPSLTVNAQDNWWGDPGGPGGAGLGKGEKISGRVDFARWRSRLVTLALTAEREVVLAEPGREDSVRLTVQNWQKADDVIEVKLTDRRGWLRSPATVAIPLRAGGGQLAVRFAISAAVAPGAVDEVRAVAVSRSDPAATGEVVFHIQAVMAMELSASPDTLTADGSKGSTLRAQLKLNGILQRGNDTTRVAFRIVRGRGILSASVAMVKGGVATTTLTSTTPGVVIVEASAAGARSATILVEVKEVPTGGVRTPDFNGDGKVDFDDFFLFAAVFGKKPGDAGFDAKYDLSRNGAVDFDDFFIFAGDFGKTTKSSKPTGQGRCE